MNNPNYTTGDRVQVVAPDGGYQRYDGKEGVVTDAYTSSDDNNGGYIEVLLEDGENISVFGYRLTPISDDWTVYRYQDIVASVDSSGAFVAHGKKVAGPYGKHAAQQAADAFDLGAGTYKIAVVSPANALSVRQIEVKTERQVTVIV